MAVIFKKIVSLILIALFSFAGVQQSVIGYTHGTPVVATRHDYCFDNDKILIGAYYGDTPYVKLASEAGLDFFISNGDADFLAECEKYNIGVIIAGYNLPTAYGNMPDSTTNAWENMNPANYKNSPAIWGDDMIDEPGANSFKNISKSVNSYYKNHPDKLPLVNLFPSYANDEQLNETSTLSFFKKALFGFNENALESTELYKKHVSDYINNIDTDYMCVDIYPYHSDLDRNGNEIKSTKDVWIKNLDILAEACRETNRDLWVITQAAGLTEKGDKDGSPRYCDEVSDISQQAYASLAFGTKAIIHAEFSPRGWWDPETSHMIGADGKPTKTYYAVKTTNEYIKSFSKEFGKYDYTSTYMLNKCRVAGSNITGNLNCEILSEEKYVSSCNGLLVGTFTGEKGSKAYIIANMEELNNSVTAHAQFTVEKGKFATVYQQGTVKKYAGGQKINLEFIPGDGAFITVK